MAQYTYKDIEEFLLDDDFFQWAKYGFINNDFNIEEYKDMHPGCEERIDFTIVLIRSLKIAEYSQSSMQEKMQSFARMMEKMQQQRMLLMRQRRKRAYRKAAIYITGMVAMLLLSFGVYHFVMQYRLPDTDLIAVVPDSLAQSEQVQVLLDGKQAVGLDKNNAEIRVDENGAVTVDNELVAASKEKKIAMNQIVVPYGKRSKVILPDGSTLWINSGTSISYGSDFCTNRKLKVQGEVFLDVKADREHPFVVNTNHLEVSVLGTAFNVTDYATDPETAVVLVRGSVNVKVANKKEVRLKPNQRLSSEAEEINVKNVDVYSYICWKDDLMNFNGQKLSDILRALSRYYNTRIETSGNIEDERCHGSLDLNCTLDEVLESISLAVPLNTIREGNVIKISPGHK